MKSHQKVQLLIMNNKQKLCQHKHRVQLYALFYLDSSRACLPLVFAMKNACLKNQGNLPFFKEKTKAESLLSDKFLL
ncbi:hypothetical protein [Moraxella lacunata]|uniref:Uncharacterized protein n=1 Tax=Moraxella lacunata TaxID=477 RepID=A0A1B8Q2I8_MORLA|nr:hypothetical protein A9309_06375 [Moraxella lacunata]OBX64200.1 hypothetical protein A9Z63_04065 [Moraxella lacunata]